MKSKTFDEMLSIGNLVNFEGEQKTFRVCKNHKHAKFKGYKWIKWVKLLKNRINGASTRGTP